MSKQTAPGPAARRNGENMGEVFALSATRNRRPVPIHIDYDEIVWSGMNGALGEIDTRIGNPGCRWSFTSIHLTRIRPAFEGLAYLVEH